MAEALGRLSLAGREMTKLSGYIQAHLIFYNGDHVKAQYRHIFKSLIEELAQKPMVVASYSAFTLLWIMSFFLQTLNFHCFRWLKEKNSTWKSLTIIQSRVNAIYTLYCIIFNVFSRLKRRFNCLSQLYAVSFFKMYENLRPFLPFPLRYTTRVVMLMKVLEDMKANKFVRAQVKNKGTTFYHHRTLSEIPWKCIFKKLYK